MRHFRCNDFATHTFFTTCRTLAAHHHTTTRQNATQHKPTENTTQHFSTFPETTPRGTQSTPQGAQNPFTFPRIQGTRSCGHAFGCTMFVHATTFSNDSLQKAMPYCSSGTFSLVQNSFFDPRLDVHCGSAAGMGLAAAGSAIPAPAVGLGRAEPGHGTPGRGVNQPEAAWDGEREWCHLGPSGPALLARPLDFVGPTDMLLHPKRLKREFCGLPPDLHPPSPEGRGMLQPRGPGSPSRRKGVREGDGRGCGKHTDS